MGRRLEAKRVRLLTTKAQGYCERVVVTTADGRVFDLGAPDSWLFKWRRKHYLWKRRNEGLVNG